MTEFGNWRLTDDFEPGQLLVTLDHSGSRFRDVVKMFAVIGAPRDCQTDVLRSVGVGKRKTPDFNPANTAFLIQGTDQCLSRKLLVGDV